MKSIWNGNITIAKVVIPIKLYSAVQPHSLGFRLLHEKCKTPLTYQRYCSHCKKEIPWRDVVKGLPLPDGSFFLITKEKIEKMKPQKTETITISECVEPEQIAPIYYDTHYYIAPTKVTQKMFFLLRDVLQKMNKVAIGQFVLREKSYVCAISAYENGLLLSTLNYAYEIRHMSNIEELSVSVLPKVTQKERDLTEKLIKKLSVKSFDISHFKDTFAQELKEQIKRKLAGKKIISKRAREAIKTPEDLVTALQESLAQKKETLKRKKPAKA